MSAATATQSELDLEARLELVTRGLRRLDARDLEIIRSVLEEKRVPKLFWGVAPTGRPHIGYLVPFVKIAEFIEAGIEVTVLLADLYAFLVNYKHPRSLVAHRTRFYRFTLSAVFESILGLPASSLRFQQETSFATTKEFILDAYQLLSCTAQADARAPNEELTNTKMLSPLLCPIVQALDEQYVDCDLQLGGLDQAGYFVYAEEFLGKIGYEKKRARMMNEMLPGLRGTKMAASDPRSKVDLLDSPEEIHQKITDAICDPGMVEGNPILALLRVVLIPISKLRLARSTATDIRECVYPPFIEADAPDGSVYSVELEIGGFRHYKSYEEIELDFLSGEVTPAALKDAVAKAITQLLAVVRNSYERNPEWQAVLKLGYPDPEEETRAPDASASFCIPALLRDVSNDRVKLTPFNSTIHATEFIRLSSQYPEVWNHGPFGPFDSAQSFISDFIETVVRPNTGMLLYAIIDKLHPPSVVDSEGALAGIISFLNTSTINQSTEIGFVVTLPPFQRTHVTSNAVGLLLNLALSPPAEGGLGFRRVQWMTSSANHKSSRTAERMGFSKEGILRWDRVYPGGKTKGKQDNGKDLRLQGTGGHFNEDDLGRDTVMFSMCWDDWFHGGKREHVMQRMAG